LRGELGVFRLDGLAYLAELLFYIADVVHVRGGGELLALGVKDVLQDLLDIDSSDVHQLDRVRQFLGLEHGHAGRELFPGLHNESAGDPVRD